LKKAVRRALISSLLSPLLAIALLWGGCLSCEQFFMWPSAKGCCAPGGQCKTKSAPAKQAGNRDCRQIAVDHQNFADTAVELPVAAVFSAVLAVPAFAHPACWRADYPADPSPPDLQILHSSFLI